MSLDLGSISQKSETSSTKPLRYPDWEKASCEEILNYTNNLQISLNSLKFPDSVRHCKDPLCKNETHTSDSVVLDILLTLVETSYTNLPLTDSTNGKRHRKPIP